MRRTSRSVEAALLAAGVLALLSFPSCRSTIRATGTRPSAERSEDGRPAAAAFFRKPLLEHVVISPDGQHIAAISARDGRETLIVRPRSGGAVRPLAKLDRERHRSSWTVRRVGWGSNEHLLVSVERPDPYGARHRARQSRLLVVDLEDARPRYLGEDWPYQEYSQYQDSVISWLPDDPDRILLSLWMPDQRGSGARLVNIRNGKLRTVARPRYGTLSWRADHREQVRAGWGTSRTGGKSFFVARVSADDLFDEIPGWADDRLVFAGFSEDPAILYVLHDGESGRRALHRYDLAARKLGRWVFGHAEVDVDGIVTSRQDGRLLAVRYTTDRPRLRIVDPEFARIQEWIDRALPGRTNRIVSTDRDRRHVILYSSGDLHPPRYFLADLESDRLVLLLAAFPELEDVELAQVKPIQYPARDGLVIHGYLTLPISESKGPLPTIVIPHGGPWARDVWGWNPVVQFLASRGFAVLQPNFRGSKGYGREFLKRGYGAWGLEMQDDISDGARWLIDQGIADPKRIGIYGASYGGFAALYALIKEPELFRAGASYAGVTDIGRMLSDDDAYWGFKEEMKKLVGDRWADRKQLQAVSPARNASLVRAPVLIGHGTEDPRVHVRQAHAMVDALEDAGAEVEAHIYEGEVHGFLDERNAIDFYTKLAVFFERNLSGLAAPAAAPPSSAAGP